mgnify:CR=1 FL=1
MSQDLLEKKIDPGRAARLYQTLSLIRNTEEHVAQVYPTDKIKSPIHLTIGQEFIAAAVCDHLTANDYVAATYRGHGAYLAKGGSLKEMVAEMYGKQTGCAKGRGGSMHLISSGSRVIGTSAVVGTGIPVAVGHAMALKMQNSKDLVVCFFGDGATEEGCFLESINFAALKKLPILFVCENNFYAIHEPLEKRWATNKLCERVATYGIETRQFKQPDILALHDYVGDALTKIRKGDGPAFIECQAYRWREHVGPCEDYDQGYRDKDEAKRWMDLDPYEHLGSGLTQIERERIDLEVLTKINDAFEFAEASAFPQPEALYDFNYAD